MQVGLVLSIVESDSVYRGDGGRGIKMGLVQEMGPRSGVLSPRSAAAHPQAAGT